MHFFLSSLTLSTQTTNTYQMAAELPNPPPIQEFNFEIGTHSDVFEGRARKMLDKRKNPEVGMARQGVKLDVSVPYRESAFFKTGVSLLFLFSFRFISFFLNSTHHSHRIFFLLEHKQAMLPFVCFHVASD